MRREPEHQRDEGERLVAVSVLEERMHRPTPSKFRGAMQSHDEGLPYLDERDHEKQPCREG
jgi:hypothetical protein